MREHEAVSVHPAGVVVDDRAALQADVGEDPLAGILAVFGEGEVADAIKMLGINRTTLYKKMKRFDISLEKQVGY